MTHLLASISLVVGPPLLLIYGARLAIQSFSGELVASMLIAAITVFYVGTLMRAGTDDHST